MKHRWINDFGIGTKVRWFLILFLSCFSFNQAYLNAQSGEKYQRSGSKRTPIYLSDLEKCQPASALAQSWRHNKWRLLSYGTKNFNGTLLLATEDSRPPDVTYPLDRKGWHAVYIGIYRKPFTSPKQVKVKLSSDPGYTSVKGLDGAKDHRDHLIDEIFWKAADLTGEKIIFRQIVQPVVQHAWIAFIKLIPLSPKEIADLHSDRQRSDSKRLWVHNDGGVINLSGTPQEILDTLEPLKFSDVSRIYWEGATGDRAKRFSKIARNHSMELLKPITGKAFFAHPYSRWFAETWMAYHQNGIDPFKVAAEYARKINIEFHAAYRPGGFIYPPSNVILPGESFYEKHPQLVCISRDGKPLPRMSYAFSETRKYVLSLFREMAIDNPIDGVAVLYNRRPPLLAYETPIVEGFKKKFGIDPREIPETDPRWLKFRAGFLTQFMRELRHELDQVGQQLKLKKRLEITAVVSRGEENLFHGMDLAAWIKEDLVDTIIPYSSAVRLGAFEPTWENPEDVNWFVSLVKGTKCRLALNFLPRDLTAEEYYRKANKLYQAGVENLFFWDGTERVRKVLRLGHQKEVSEWMEKGQPPHLPNSLKVRSLGGWDLQMETPG